AVLANPIAELPEAARLGWLLAQLQQDIAVYSERIPRPVLPRVAAMAMLPPALAAAEEVELVRPGDDVTALALEPWPNAHDEQAELLGTLVRWWQAYVERRPPWGVALSALSTMLDELEC